MKKNNNNNNYKKVFLFILFYFEKALCKQNAKLEMFSSFLWKCCMLRTLHSLLQSLKTASILLCISCIFVIDVRVFEKNENV